MNDTTTVELEIDVNDRLDNFIQENGIKKVHAVSRAVEDYLDQNQESKNGGEK